MCRRAQMLCVSEYLPNGDLEAYIPRERARADGRPRELSWAVQGRYIALHVACGLAFLHAHKVSGARDLHIDCSSHACTAFPHVASQDQYVY